MSEDYLKLLEDLKDHGMNPLGSVVSSLHNLYRMPTETQEKVKGLLLVDSFRHHYENNSYYRAMCERAGVTPDDVKTFEDVIKIPVIPVKRFKETDSHILLSKGLDTMEFEMRSTGTSGIPSVSRRCTPTMDDTFLSVIATYREFFRLSRGAILYLMPSTEEMPEMGMVKALNVFSGMVDASKCLLKRYSFSTKEAQEVLENWENLHTRHIMGPPFLVYRFIQYLERNDIRMKLDKNTRVVTMGGWKRFTGMEISREEFNAKCAEYLGIEEDQIRDMYGLVEGNMLAVECKQQNKHVPPWVHFSVRDQDDLTREVPQGKRGILAIMDPTCQSYPGYILTEDVVFLDKENSCECGRSSQKINYLSRISGAEIGCCAINLERQMSEKGELGEVCILEQEA